VRAPCAGGGGTSPEMTGTSPAWARTCADGARLEDGQPSHVVEVVVGEDDAGQVADGRIQGLDVGQDGAGAAGHAGVDQGQGAVQQQVDVGALHPWDAVHVGYDLHGDGPPLGCG